MTKNNHYDILTNGSVYESRHLWIAKTYWKKIGIIKQSWNRKNLIRKEFLKNQIIEIERIINPNSNNIENVLKSFFKVSEAILEEKLVKFFKLKEDLNEDRLPVSLKKVIIRIKGKLYVLWDKDGFNYTDKSVSLEFLYKNKKFFTWNELLLDYPELKDVLWDTLKENQNIEKYNKFNLIKKMLLKNKKELEILTNPEKLNIEINKILNQINQNEVELKELENGLNLIEI